MNEDLVLAKTQHESEIVVNQLLKTDPTRPEESHIWLLWNHVCLLVEIPCGAAGQTGMTCYCWATIRFWTWIEMVWFKSRARHSGGGNRYTLPSRRRTGLSSNHVELDWPVIGMSYWLTPPVQWHYCFWCTQTAAVFWAASAGSVQRCATATNWDAQTDEGGSWVLIAVEMNLAHITICMDSGWRDLVWLVLRGVSLMKWKPLGIGTFCINNMSIDWW